MITRNIGFPNGDPRNAEGAVTLAGETWRLRPEAAGALRALNAEYRSRFGEDIRPLETMRSLATQEHYYALYQAGRGNLAAVPGTSNHGWGLAADLAYPLDRTSTEQHKWLVNAAPAYGWWWAGRNFSQVEPWHFEYGGDGITAEQTARYRADGLTPIQDKDGFLMALDDDQQKRMLKQSDLNTYAMDKIMLPVLSRVEQRTFESLKLTRGQSALIREQNALLTRIANALEKK